MNTKIIIFFGILLVVFEVGIIGGLVYLKNHAPPLDEQAKINEDACGQLADSGGVDVLGLSVARGKAVDASIKANLSSIRVQAELYYENHSNYGESAVAAERSERVCTIAGTMFAPAGDPSEFTVAKALADAEARCEPSSKWVATCALGGNSGVATSYAVSVPLKAGGSWCVDSNGISRMGKAEGGGKDPARCSGGAEKPIYTRPDMPTPVVPEF